MAEQKHTITKKQLVSLGRLSAALMKLWKRKKMISPVRLLLAVNQLKKALPVKS